MLESMDSHRLPTHGVGETIKKDDSSKGVGCSPLHEDAVALGTMLRFNQNKSHELHLEHVVLNDGSAVAVFDGLQCNTTLKKLYITVDNIGHTGAAALGRMLARNKTLRYLCLIISSPITNRGAMAIANGLKNNWSLELFYLKDSKSGEVDVLINRRSASNQWDSQRSLV